MSKGDIIFSTDSYMGTSIESTERKRRGESEKFFLGGPATKKPADWKQFLMNDEKKAVHKPPADGVAEKYICVRSHGCQVILACNGKAYALSSNKVKHVKLSMISLRYSSQEETDTRSILYRVVGSG